MEDWFLTDQLYRECIEQAQESEMAREHYGALFVSDAHADRRILGRGYNRSSDPADRIQMSPICHGEVASINDAMDRGKYVRGAEIYVAGYFIDNFELNIRSYSVFTCLLCPSILEKAAVSLIHVPTSAGWAALSPQEALRTAKELLGDSTTNNTAKRRQVGSSGFFLDTLKKN